MPGLLATTPAKVIRQLLIDLGLASDGGPSWPAYSPNVPDLPNVMIAVTDTAGRDGGREMATGERAEHDGIQILLRDVDEDSGFLKAKQVAIALDAVSYENVSVGGHTYTVATIVRTGPVLPLGKAVPSSKRWMFSINAVVSLRMEQ